MADELCYLTGLLTPPHDAELPGMEPHVICAWSVRKNANTMHLEAETSDVPPVGISRGQARRRIESVEMDALSCGGC